MTKGDCRWTCTAVASHVKIVCRLWFLLLVVMSFSKIFIGYDPSSSQYPRIFCTGAHFIASLRCGYRSLITGTSCPRPSPRSSSPPAWIYDDGSLLSLFYVSFSPSPRLHPRTKVCIFTIIYAKIKELPQAGIDSVKKYSPFSSDSKTSY